MRVIGLTLFIIGGGWTGVWALEKVFAQKGIYQALGDVDTTQARADADQRGKRHQQRMLSFFRRGLALAIAVAVAGLVLMVVAN